MQRLSPKQVALSVPLIGDRKSDLQNLRIGLFSVVKSAFVQIANGDLSRPYQARGFSTLLWVT